MREWRTGEYRSSRNIQPTGEPAGPVVVKVALMETDLYCESIWQAHFAGLARENSRGLQRGIPFRQRISSEPSGMAHVICALLVAGTAEERETC